MKRQAWIATSLTLVLIAATTESATAGIGSLFSSKCCDQCESCGCGKKKKSSLLDVDDPPRASTVTAVPAQLTNQRGERVPQKPQAPAVPPAPACSEEISTQREIEALQREVQILKEQLRVLTTLLQENTKK